MGAGSLGSETSEPISGINVTPFVDVVLVLLVIFMITAPVLSKELLQVNLPKAASGEQKISESLGIVVTQQGQILVNGQLSDLESLADTVRQKITTDPKLQALISADRESKHSDLVKVIDVLKTAGLSRFALQVEHPQSP